MFLRLLDHRKGGHCSVDVASVRATSRRYLGPTDILETTFVAQGGRLVLIDFMPDLSQMQLTDLLRDRQKHWRAEFGAAAV
jgi:hypothetical protein